MTYRRSHQIRMGNMFTYDTFGLVPVEVPTVNSPEVKTEIIEIPGYSVSYDFTEALQGSVPLGRREGDWSFNVLGGNELQRINLEAAIHGKHFDEIELDGVVYSGRLYLTEWRNHNNPEWAECTISYNLEPIHS